MLDTVPLGVLRDFETFISLGSPLGIDFFNDLLTADFSGVNAGNSFGELIVTTGAGPGVPDDTFFRLFTVDSFQRATPIPAPVPVYLFLAGLGYAGIRRARQ